MGNTVKCTVQVVLVSVLLLLGGCSSMRDKPTEEVAKNGASDPLESVNRSLFDFNWKVLDKYVLKPAAIGYSQYVPDPLKSGLLNMAQNLEEPVTLVNDILQFKIKDAGVTTGRFLLNSTIGLLGFFDVASELGLDRKEEDFAQTLGVWGVDHGVYLMIPAMGPSTTKDLSGDVVDSVAFSFNLLSWPQSLLKLTIKTLDSRVQLISQEQLLNDSLDPYQFTKSSYLQRQEYKLYDGQVPQVIDPYFEDEALILDEEISDEAVIDEVEPIQPQGLPGNDDAF